MTAPIVRKTRNAWKVIEIVNTNEVVITNPSVWVHRMHNIHHIQNLQMNYCYRTKDSWKQVMVTNCVRKSCQYKKRFEFYLNSLKLIDVRIAESDVHSCGFTTPTNTDIGVNVRISQEKDWTNVSILKTNLTQIDDVSTWLQDPEKSHLISNMRISHVGQKNIGYNTGNGTVEKVGFSRNATSVIATCCTKSCKYSKRFTFRLNSSNLIDVCIDEVNIHSCSLESKKLDDFIQVDELNMSTSPIDKSDSKIHEIESTSSENSDVNVDCKVQEVGADIDVCSHVNEDLKLEGDIHKLASDNSLNRLSKENSQPRTRRNRIWTNILILRTNLTEIIDTIAWLRKPEQNHLVANMWLSATVYHRLKEDMNSRKVVATCRHPACKYTKRFTFKLNEHNLVDVYADESDVHTCSDFHEKMKLVNNCHELTKEVEMTDYCSPVTAHAKSEVETLWCLVDEIKNLDYVYEPKKWLNSEENRILLSGMSIESIFCPKNVASFKEHTEINDSSTLSNDDRLLNNQAFAMVDGCDQGNSLDAITELNDNDVSENLDSKILMETITISIPDLNKIKVNKDFEDIQVLTGDNVYNCDDAIIISHDAIQPNLFSPTGCDERNCDKKSEVNITKAIDCQCNLQNNLINSDSVVKYKDNVFHVYTRCQRRQCTYRKRFIFSGDESKSKSSVLIQETSKHNCKLSALKNSVRSGVENNNIIETGFLYLTVLINSLIYISG